MTNTMGGGEPDRIQLEDDDTGSFWSGLFSRGTGQNARKTVTFGDAGAVRSKPFWSIVSLFGIVLLWFVGTTPFGFPDEFRDAEQAKLTASALEDQAEAIADGKEDPGVKDHLTDKNLLAACTRAPDDVCSDADYSQFLGPGTFPSPADTWNGFKVLNDIGFANFTLWEHTKASLWRVMRGLFYGTLFGVPIGMAMGLSSRLRGFFDTPVELFRPIPPLALVPLFILWFGIGDETAVNLLIFASIWIMIIGARAGVRTVNLSKVRAAYSLGASKRQILSRVILPNALPELFTAARVAVGVSWGTLVAAEFVGTPNGLGTMINTARNFFRLDIVVVGIIIIALLGVAMDVLMRFLESILIPWRGKG
ncbi:MAG: ABC transporter permease [Acidimicrobiales bacterium]|nr:ABC transporter permease [Acidimicrobiales bacterium]